PRDRAETRADAGEMRGDVPRTVDDRDAIDMRIVEYACERIEHVARHAVADAPSCSPIRRGTARRIGRRIAFRARRGTVTVRRSRSHETRSRLAPPGCR